MRHVFNVAMVCVAALALVATVAAETIEIPGTSWQLGGETRLKVKKDGKFKQGTLGSLTFERNGGFRLVLEELFTVDGIYECKRHRCVLTPDPDSLEHALVSLLEKTVFAFALRGVEPGKVRFKVKVRSKKDTDFIKTRFKIKFDALLALAQENPDDADAEVIEPFRMRFKFKGTSPLG